MTGNEHSRAGNDLTEYDFPVLYDLENTLDREWDFFLALARETGGPILDIACGSGRIALPLAREGFDCVGIDLSQPMLDHAIRQAGSVPAAFQRADMRDFALGTEFALAICTAHAFQFLLTEEDQRRFLIRAQRHLRPGGLLVFESRNPTEAALAPVTRSVLWKRYRLPDGSPMELSYTARPGENGERMHYALTRLNTRTGWRQDFTTDLHFSRDEDIRRRIAEAGLTVEAVYGDFECSPVGPDSPELIYVARKPV